MDKSGLRIAIITLGCKLNYSESSLFASQLRERGYTVVTTLQSADLYIVNTCSVTEHADKKCRNLINRIHRVNTAAPIVVAGCYAQLKGEGISALEGVKIVVGADAKKSVAEIADRYIKEHLSDQQEYSCRVDSVREFFPAYSSADRTRSFLKIQDGCDYHCSYCTVPLARGNSRSDSIAGVIKSAQEIASKGVKEIVLTGVNTGDFGKSTGESFEDLLKALNEVDGIERYRISSIEPNLLTDSIIEWISGDTKFLPHFHIPLQSGSDAILKLMRRRYNTDTFENKIALLKDRIPFVYIGVDVIVGFPSESDELFDQTYNLLERVEPAFLHIFPYSPRSNTPAALMPDQVPESVKKRRVELLTNLSDRMQRHFFEINRGREEEVLFEARGKNGMMYGYSRNYIKVEREYDSELIGKIVKLRID